MDLNEKVHGKVAISVTATAKLLSISRANAYALAHRADFFPAFRIGNRLLVSVDRLNEWVNEQTLKGAA